ncbi:MAG TPA: class I SAM-dependent rRNA methyltransferase [Gemmatimonadales bacterium]|nr:class I SAM-dependent rRNA methyltransferase [Gemmatimonadales bacterium]
MTDSSVLTRPVIVSAKGAARWEAGHPWIYRTDVYDEPRGTPGVVTVTDRRGRHLGQALYSPTSEIRLRLLTPQRETIDATWWADRIAAAARRRAGIPATAYRVVHGEGDGLPSLVIDRYGPYVVAQLLSAGLEQVRADVLDGIGAALAPEGILLRNDTTVRRHEGLPLEVTPGRGTVPDTVAVEEAGVRYLAAPHTGQKTGAFLDQRENRVLVGEHTGAGRALDLFTYHGSFALHLARRAGEVVAVDSSAEALARGRENAALNELTNITWREANAFDLLRELERREELFDTIVLDPPAFAKAKQSVARALAGYKEINLRAMRLVAPGGVLFTCSCSYHVSRAVFLDMLGDAARDAGRRLQLIAITGAGRDHPELVNVPETGYLKGALLRAVD